MEYRVEINQKDINKIKKALSKATKKAPHLIRNAVNKAARAARKEMVQKAKSTYYYKDGFRINDIAIYNATDSMLVATLKGSVAEKGNRERTMEKYKIRVLKGGVKAAEMKAGGINFLGEKGRRAFKGTGGKIAGLVAQRTLDKDEKGRAKLRVPKGSSQTKMYEMAWKGGGKAGFEAMPDPVLQKLHDDLQTKIREVM